MGIMMQFFEYDISFEDRLWRILPFEVNRLSSYGITSLWVPPATKGSTGIYDVGYGPYDLYDLGEFDQKWHVPTKYGYKYEYIDAIKECHKAGVQVYGDIVLNHKMGSDDVNVVTGQRVSKSNRNKKLGKPREIYAPTQFNYDRRGNIYSAFKWTGDHFTGVDVDVKTGKHDLYLLNGKSWSKEVDDEFGNYDYLMGSNIDHNQKDVREELIRWGKWYVKQTNVDGFRLDAIKHIDASFYKDWLQQVRGKKEMFAVGEYWSGKVDKLLAYLKQVDYSMSLFDVPLHYNLYNCSISPDKYDMRGLLMGTLLINEPSHCVTFVDNHDTQPHQGLQSFVKRWFKPFAYALILLRGQGYPCIFYGDYYGLKYGNHPSMQQELEQLLVTNKRYGHGYLHDYVEEDYFGFTREGGIACVMNVRHNDEVKMFVGKHFANMTFKDMYSNHYVQIDQHGDGLFRCRKKQMALYVPVK